MKEISRKEYWDDIYDRSSGGGVKPSASGAFKRWLRGLFSDRAREAWSSYSDYLLWRVIYPKYLGEARGSKVLEIGSAPGRHLVRLKRQFDVTPFGLDYSQTGVAVNRELFAEAGIPEENVIHASFLDDEAMGQYRQAFDVVLSRGFVEHFDTPSAIVRRHADLVAPRGLLIVSIPNIRKVNLLLTRFFHPEMLAIHNLEIMLGDRFRDLFTLPELDVRWCGYYGTFSFGLFNVPARSRKRHLLSLCCRLQKPMNLLFYALFRDRGYESRWFSPHLICVCTRKAE